MSEFARLQEYEVLRKSYWQVVVEDAVVFESSNHVEANVVCSRLNEVYQIRVADAVREAKQEQAELDGIIRKKNEMMEESPRRPR